MQQVSEQPLPEIAYEHVLQVIGSQEVAASAGEAADCCCCCFGKGLVLVACCTEATAKGVAMRWGLAFMSSRILGVVFCAPGVLWGPALGVVMDCAPAWSPRRAMMPAGVPCDLMGVGLTSGVAGLSAGCCEAGPGEVAAVAVARRDSACLSEVSGRQKLQRKLTIWEVTPLQAVCCQTLQQGVSHSISSQPSS